MKTTLSYPPRLRLARIPTPVEPVSLSRVAPGFQLYVKRDDLTGTGLTGNKIRKLEFLLADAKRRRCDTIITCGGVQSNHARAVAIASAQIGCRSVLFLRGSARATNEANLLLDRVIGAETVFISVSDYKNHRDTLMADYAQELESQGRRPYVIVEGGSDAIGAWGYIRAVAELKRQTLRRRLGIRGIVTAVGSGGTYAGLLLGVKLLQWNIPVFGINVCDNRSHFEQLIYTIMKETITRYALPVHMRRSDIRILDGYVGEGYGIATAEVYQCIRQVAAETGLLLDPVYTGKAFFGMLREMDKGTFGKKGSLVFLHSGGLFGLLTQQHASFYTS